MSLVFKLTHRPLLLDNSRISELRDLIEDLWHYEEDPSQLPRMIAGWKPYEVPDVQGGTTGDTGVYKESTHFLVRYSSRNHAVSIQEKNRD